METELLQLIEDIKNAVSHDENLISWINERLEQIKQ